MVDPRQLNVFGPWDSAGQKPPTLDVHCPVPDAMDDERPHPNRGKNVGDIDLAIHLHQGNGGRGTGAEPLEAAPKLLKCPISLSRWREPGQGRPLTPVAIDVS